MSMKPLFSFLPSAALKVVCWFFLFLPDWLGKKCSSSFANAFQNICCWTRDPAWVTTAGKADVWENYALVEPED